MMYGERKLITIGGHCGLSILHILNLAQPLLLLASFNPNKQKHVLSIDTIINQLSSEECDGSSWIVRGSWSRNTGMGARYSGWEQQKQGGVFNTFSIRVSDELFA